MIDGNIDVLSLEGQIVDSISLEGDLLPIGPKGDKGDPGFSPVVTTSKDGKTTTIKFETATGNVYAYIQDGEDGQGSGDMLTDVYDKNKNGIVDNAEKVNGKTVEENVPANAKFTDTIYDDTEVRNLINAKPDFTDIPTNVSELTNDANYVSSDGASTVSGENTELSLNGTTEGMFKELDLKGNTSQKTLSGKNLLKVPSSVSRTLNGLTFTVNNDGSVSVSGTTTQSGGFSVNLDNPIVLNGNYTFSLKTVGTISTLGQQQWLLRDSDNTTISGPTVGSNQTRQNVFTSNKTAPILQIYTANNITLDCTIYPQLEVGNDHTEWEQYCGGIPSPNPDYPQDVNNVSGDNDIKIEGKNLYNSNFRNDYNGIAFSRCTGSEKNGIYTLTATASDMYFWYAQSSGGNYTKDCGPLFEFNADTYTLTTTNPLFINNYVTYYDENKVSLGFIGKNANSFTINKNDKNNAKYFSIRIGYGRATAGETYSTSVQLEKGSTATTYEIYTGTTYNIDLPSGMELNKIGTYQDYFYKENDKWYLHKEIGKVVLDGSESWNLNETNTNTMRFVVEGGIINALNTSTNNFKNNMFNEYTGNAGINSIDSEGISIRDLKNGITIRANISRVSNLAGFKSWLSTNNVIVDYVLATPTNTEITDTTLISQLNALYKAYTYKNQTNISQSNNDLPFILNVEAFTDTYNGRYENIINMIKKVQ